jgi:hypothetical protein
VLCRFGVANVTRPNSLASSLAYAVLFLLSSNDARRALRRFAQKVGTGTDPALARRRRPSMIRSTDQMIMFGGQHAPTAIVDFHDVWSVKNVIAASAVGLRKPELGFSLNAVGTPPSDRFGHSGRLQSHLQSNGCVRRRHWISRTLRERSLDTDRIPIPLVARPPGQQLSPTGTLASGARGPRRRSTIPRANTMIVFGGTDCNGNYYNDLWILSNADGSTGTPKWTQAKTSPERCPQRARRAPRPTTPVNRTS